MQDSLAQQWTLLTDRNCDGHSSCLELVELVTVPGAGRGLRCTRDLLGGEVVLEDGPVVTGPSERSTELDCCGCFIDKASTACVCGLGFCSETCRGRSHPEQECHLIQKLPQPRPHPSKWLLILKAFLSKDARIQILEGDETKMSDSSHIWSNLNISGKEAVELNAVLMSNTFRRGSGRCLCPAMAMVNHSCVSNCRVHWEEGNKMVLTARRKINKGEELTITYCSSLMGTYARQKKLLKSKLFQCFCQRCLDPLEGGTNMGGITCSKCKQSFLLPHVRANQTEIVWLCRCGFQANSEKVSNFLTKLERELTDIDQLEEEGLDNLRTKLEQYNTWVQKKYKLLPPSSDLLLRAGGSLALLLSRLGPSLPLLEKREELISQRIKVLDQVDSASRSRLKGFEMFKLHLILYEKVKLLTVQRKPTDQNKMQNLVFSMQLSLLEAHFLLADDLLAPGGLGTAYTDMERALQLVDVKQLETLQQIVIDKYV